MDDAHAAAEFFDDALVRKIFADENFGVGHVRQS
jgi:hypothetical protein